MLILGTFQSHLGHYINMTNKEVKRKIRLFEIGRTWREGLKEYCWSFEEKGQCANNHKG